MNPWGTIAAGSSGSANSTWTELAWASLNLATSLVEKLWDEAEVYPNARCELYALTADQGEILRLYGARNDEG